MAGFPSYSCGSKCSILLMIVVLTVLSTPTNAHTLPRRRPDQWRPIFPFRRQISRITRIPPALNAPMGLIEDMFGRMGSTMRQLPGYTTRMFRNKVKSMARTGRRVNNGVLKFGRSISSMVKGWIS